MTEQEIGLLVTFFGGLTFGIWLWSAIAVSYLKDIREELRKLNWKKQ